MPPFISPCSQINSIMKVCGSLSSVRPSVRPSAHPGTHPGPVSHTLTQSRPSPEGRPCALRRPLIWSPMKNSQCSEGFADASAELSSLFVSAQPVGLRRCERRPRGHVHGRPAPMCRRPSPGGADAELVSSTHVPMHASSSDLQKKKSTFFSHTPTHVSAAG